MIWVAVILLLPWALGFGYLALFSDEVTPGDTGKFKALSLVALFAFAITAAGLWRGSPWAKSSLVAFHAIATLVFSGFSVLMFVGWALLDGKLLLGLGLACLFAAPAALCGSVAYLVAFSPSVQGFLMHRRNVLSEPLSEKQQEVG